MTATHSTGYRVLVVGFEKALVRHFSVFLKIFEYKVVDTALSVGEAFRKAQANPPDILIVMALLPEMSGVDVGLRISRQSRCSVLFVAAMDTKDFEHTLEQLRGQGSCACFCRCHSKIQTCSISSKVLSKISNRIGSRSPFTGAPLFLGESTQTEPRPRRPAEVTDCNIRPDEGRSLARRTPLNCFINTQSH
jgi:CheY-like chemotaxis protein